MNEKVKAVIALENACFLLAHSQSKKSEKMLAEAERKIARLLELSEDELKEIREY